MFLLGTNLEKNRVPVVTLTLIAINTVVFIFEGMLSDAALEWVFNAFGIGLVTKNPLAPFTSMFLHGDTFHLLFNMLYLWIFGAPVEERIGAKKFLYYYLGAGLAAEFLYLHMEIVAGSDHLPAIGASGAVSGVIALHLYRCYYSKLKMVFDPVWPRWRFTIPAAPWILFWFYQNVNSGITSMTDTYGVAYWAHIGGFLFGLAVGRINRYGHEAQLEHLGDKVLRKLAKGEGWEKAEKELLKLLRLSPGDPDLHHDLARLYLQKDQPRKAGEHYKKAFHRYFIKDPLGGAYAVLEYVQAFSRIESTQHHLKAAEVFLQYNRDEEALQVLEPIERIEDRENSVVEKAMAFYIRMLIHLDKRSEAKKLYADPFTKIFPRSRYDREIREASRKQPRMVLETARPEKPEVSPERKPSDKDERKSLGVVAFVERFITDPFFWLLFIVLDLLSVFFLPPSSTEFASLFILVAAFFITVIYRLLSVSDLFTYLMRPSPEEAGRQVDLKRLLDRALMAEETKQFTRAVELYEEALRADSKNGRVRYNLARLYHQKLKDHTNARRQYRKVLHLLPGEHLFHRFAREALEELKPPKAQLHHVNP
jgi:membrane associated rhomboid family serine protease